jgi:hypothetical protein
LGVLGTQETFCIVIAGLFERDSFDLFLPEFDKPWVVQLRETYCCSTNLCSWRPNTVYKNRRMRRHQWASMFNRAGRSELVRSTLAAIPIFSLMSLNVQVETLLAIEKILRGFL